MSRNSELTAATLGRLTGLGISQFVVCVGARNAPLVTSLIAARTRLGLKIWHHFDERTAAFFALGLSKAENGPVAVLTTSGTAAAELLPATIESYYTGIPLVLVTADRPECYRGSGAPQAIEQRGLFGIYAPLSIDVQNHEDLSWAARWDRKSPLHLNICLEEPRADDQVDEFKLATMPEPQSENDDELPRRVAEFVRAYPDAVCILGALPLNWRMAVREFLKRSGLAFWAEATSGLRECDDLKAQQVVRETGIASIKFGAVLRIGGVPSLRLWRELESLREVDVLSISPHPFSGLARRSDLIVSSDFPPEIQVASQKREVDPETSQLEAALLRFPRSEPAMMRSVTEMIPEKAMVFLGNSMPIREWNLAATMSPHPNCFANRGANGIDGEVATFLGLSGKEKESWGIFGDLTALYDLNAPAILSQLPKGRRRFVVMNNGGGRIFSRLPAMEQLDTDVKSVTENHHSHRLEAWAEMWKMKYVAWGAGKAAPEIKGDNVVVEVLLDNSVTESFWNELA